MHKKIVLFDFDGVIAHTLKYSFDIHKKVNSDFSWAEFQDMSEGNFFDGYKEKLQSGKHVHPEYFQEEYQEQLQALSIEKSMGEEIKKLSSSGYVLFVVSSTNTKYIREFLEKEKILSYFKDILGSDVHLSKVIKIQSILYSESILPNQCVFITDTVGDIKEAQKCKVSSIGVSWGLHSKEKLEKEGAYTVLVSPDELMKKIFSFFDTI